ncbi:MAG: hypothetical protein PHV21_01835 [Synergistaceae bacterium]|nr:hypothetical protein [Synergistaceae bacterium]
MRNAVFLGPSGGGKSEISINMALRAAAEDGPAVHFFDMDQTKPLFRSRACRDLLERSGVVFHSGAEFLDSPVIPDGVADFLRDPACRCILDVGGNPAGARPLGRLAALREADAAAFYVINVYRPFSDEQSLREDMERIVASARIPAPCVVSNPNLGRETTLDDVLEGHRRLLPLLERLDAPLDRLCVRLPLLESVRPLVDCPVAGIALHLDGREVK